MPRTKIDYVTDSWNPVVGCSPVSEGCRSCYAARLAATRLKHHPLYKGLAEMVDGKPQWTGEVRLNEKALEEPLRARNPRRYLVCSMGDLFHEDMGADVLHEIWEVMRRAPRHIFLILTKRPEHMGEFILYDSTGALPNIWPGVTVETQDQMWRVEELRRIPAAGHWVSLEPCLGPVKIPMSWLHPYDINHLQHIGLVVLGGETGPNARPMHPDWARTVRDDCVAADTAFFFKGWGEWGPVQQSPNDRYHIFTKYLPLEPGRRMVQAQAYRVGKKAAGRFLDEEEWDQLPDALRLPHEKGRDNP